MNALRRIHAVLEPGGLVVDSQPLSAHPPVHSGGREMGTLDMDDWRATIDAVDRRVIQTIEDGLFALDAAHSFVVTDLCDTGHEFLEAVSGWRGTRISPALAQRVAAVPSTVSVDQEVRLRLLQALDGA
ncbi:MAG: hypothetical protein V7607_1361 [Solirubrobacteraceae bacterium]